jgi:hypothetical protein
MCEIQFIKRLNKDLSKFDKEQFIDMMRKGAISNGDAYGIFSRNYMMKEGISFKTKIKNLERDSMEFKVVDTNFLVGHNRFTTSGKAKDNYNNHPFEEGDFIIVHNGVIWNDDELKKMYNLDYKEEVDSAIIGHLLNHLVVKQKESITNAIKIVAESLEGSFSIMIYVKSEDNLYYFKNSKTTFFFSRVVDDDGITILGSTNETTLEESHIEFDMIFPINRYKSKVIIEAQDEIVYKIDNYQIMPIDTFVASKTKSHNNWGYRESYYKTNYPTSFDITDWEDEYPQIDDFIDEAKEDMDSTYGLNSYQCDYKQGTLWFRCNDKTVLDTIRGTYYFLRESKKGFILDFDELYSFFGEKYNVSKVVEEDEIDIEFEEVE